MQDPQRRYQESLVSLIGLAQQGKLNPELAAWAPNAVFGLIGLVLLAGVDRPGDRDYLSRFRAARDRVLARSKEWMASSRSSAPRRLRAIPRIPILVPGVIDTYVLTTFLT